MQSQLISNKVKLLEVTFPIFKQIFFTKNNDQQTSEKLRFPNKKELILIVKWCQNETISNKQLKSSLELFTVSSLKYHLGFAATIIPGINYHSLKPSVTYLSVASFHESLCPMNLVLTKNNLSISKKSGALISGIPIHFTSQCSFRIQPQNYSYSLSCSAFEVLPLYSA